MDLAKKIILSAFILFSYICSFSQHTNDRFFDSRDSVEAWLKQNKVPCLGIGVLRERVIREIRMYGEIKLGTPAPYNAVFNVASLTKPVVSILTLKLVNSGVWNLDEPLYKYWIDPDIKNDPRHKLLTTRLVLSHQTGFKNWRYLNKDNKLSFDTTPGVRFGYSGEGFEYLRKALEKKFNKSIERLADSILFRPLNMTDTRFTWDKHTDESRFAHWYNSEGKEYQQDYKKTALNAADDLLTTIEDYGKFGAYILKGAGLDSGLFNLMVKPGFKTPMGSAISLGWEMFDKIGSKNENAIFHSGGDAGVQTLIVLIPKSGEGLIIFTNGDEGYKLYDRLITEFLSSGKQIMDRVKGN